MKNQQRLIVGLVLALVLIVFALLNGQPVAVNFFGAAFHWPLIIVIVVAVLIGAVIALLASGNAMAATKKEVAQLKQENARLAKAQKLAAKPEAEKHDETGK